MSRNKKPAGLINRLIYRYRNLPKDLHSRKFSEKNNAQRLLALTICIPVMAASAVYIIHWTNVRGKIEADNKAYSELYSADDITPTATVESDVSVSKQITSLPLTPTPTFPSTRKPTAVPIETAQPHSVTEAPVQTLNPTPTTAPISSTVPEPKPTESTKPEFLEDKPSAEPFEIADDELLFANSTPNSETLVIGMETPPPVQSSFDELIATNPETIGYLKVGSQISLPVVQRTNDNEFYLNHNFSLEESDGGTLFMDGSNLLVPEDRVLLVYGHNMRNGTMFQPLTCFERIDYLRANPVIRFDTIYKNRLYMPIAVFRASMEPTSPNYLNIRQFSFDETQWELYILKLEKLSMYKGDIDAKYGDHLLLLVTCEYTHENGRLVVVCRQLRDGESIETAREALANIAEK